jgi:hypothetical protein
LPAGVYDRYELTEDEVKIVEGAVEERPLTLGKG